MLSHCLTDAGAVLMGKATLSEWADMRSNNYSEGYSGRGGQAYNSYNFTVNPGGSSSGSAIAVSNNVVPFALGTETDGSVINPAERNAIVGFKPTVGLTSRAGVIPESEHQDTVRTLLAVGLVSMSEKSAKSSFPGWMLRQDRTRCCICSRCYIWC